MLMCQGCGDLLLSLCSFIQYEAYSTNYHLYGHVSCAGYTSFLSSRLESATFRHPDRHKGSILAEMQHCLRAVNDDAEDLGLAVNKLHPASHGLLGVAWHEEHHEARKHIKSCILTSMLSQSWMLTVEGDKSVQ